MSLKIDDLENSLKLISDKAINKFKEEMNLYILIRNEKNKLIDMRFYNRMKKSKILHQIINKR